MTDQQRVTDEQLTEWGRVAADDGAEAAEVERDGLQQRIDKALTLVQQANPYPELNGDVFADIRAALTGKTQGGTDD